MKRPVFFRSPEVQRLLQRASRAAAAPVAVHYVSGGTEGPCATSTPGCEACKAVDKLPGGHDACRASRNAAARETLRKGYPEAFVCHMGFMCVAATVDEVNGSGFVLTAGPFNPSEAPQIMYEEARARYEALGGSAEEAPLPLDDIRAAPVDGVIEIVEWTIESIRALPDTTGADAEEADGEDAPKPRRRSRIHEPGEDAFDAETIARALAASDTKRARQRLVAVLGESRTNRGGMAAVRARCLAITAAVLESSSALGLNTAAAEHRLPEFHAMVAKRDSANALIEAAMHVLRRVSRAVQQAQRPNALAAMDAYVLPRLGDGVTVAEVAQHLGVDPSAVSHRLRRKYGMTFTEYLGRMRVDQAKDMLRKTTLNVTEVSRRVGVSDASNFARLFRKYERMTPLEYRQRYGKGT